MKKVYTFRDLKFGPHSVNTSIGRMGVQAKLDLPNNVTVSVVGGDGLYGDGVDTFEVAAWYTDSGHWIKLGDHDDVKDYVSKDEIDFIIFELSKL